MVDVLQNSGTTFDSVVLFSARFYGIMHTFHNSKVTFFLLCTTILPPTGFDMLLHDDKHQNQQIFGSDHISCVDKLTTPNLKYQICSNKLKDVRYRLKSYHLIEFAGERSHQSAVAHDDFCSFKAFCSTLHSVFFLFFLFHP